MKKSSPNQSEFLSEKELAHLLRMSVRTLQRHRKLGNLAFPFCRVGQRTLYERNAVMARFNDGQGV